MLVLSRQRDETIMIGDDIEITIVDISGDKVRLGITAPATIPVHRKEVYEAIQRENRAASQVKMEDMQSLPKPAGGGVVKPGSVPPGLHRPKPPLPPAARPGPTEHKDAPHAGASNGTVPPPASPPAPQTPPGNANGTLPPPQ